MGVAQQGIYWPFKTLLQGSGISLTEDATTIRITNTGGVGGGSGDMLSSQYAANGAPGVVDKAVLAEGLAPGAVVPTAQVAQSVPWSGITGVPSSFPADWSTITSKPTVFPPTTHAPTHRGKGTDPIAIADTTDSGLLALLSGAVTDYVGGDNQCHSLPATFAQYGAVPTGTCLEWYGLGLPAGGWIWADGSAISRVTYAALFAVYGTFYGAGDGSSTFNVPNKQGVCSIGWQANVYGLGQTGGEPTHVLAWNEMPVHNHAASVSDGGHTHGIYYIGSQAPGGYLDGLGDAGQHKGVDYSSATPATCNIGVGIGNAGSSWGHNNLQPYIVAYFIIKT